MNQHTRRPQPPVRPPNAKARHGARAGLAAVLVVLGLCVLQHAQAACKLRSLEMPVTMVGLRPTVTVRINDTDVRLLVDSGAFYSMLTDATAAQLKLRVTHLPFGMRVHGATGPIDARLTTVKRLQLLKGEFADVEFLVGGNELGGGIMGLLGRNLLAFTDVEYDLAQGMIRFMFPEGECEGRNLAYWAADTPVSELALLRDARSKSPALRAIGQLNGKDVEVLFDTGAVSIVSLAAARRAGITEAEMTPTAAMRGAGQGEAKAWVAPVGTFELAGETVRNSRLRIGNFESDDHDMLLGVDFFLSHRIYVSKSQRRMFFTYNGGPVFALNAAPPAAAASGAAASNPPPQNLDAAAHARRGVASAARGDLQRALADLDRACEMEPQGAGHFLQRGRIHLAMRQPAQALQDFDTALRLDNTQAEARLHRALLRASTGPREGALDDLQVLDRTIAPQAPMRLTMADLYLRLNRPESAVAQWNLWVPARDNDASLPTVLNNRCWTRALLGIELDQAIDDCDRALDLKPKTAAYLDSRAWVRLRRGELGDALADFDRALDLRPDGAWSLYGRGIVRTRLGDVEPGRADIEAARKLRPTIDAEAGRYGLAAEPRAVPAMAAPAGPAR
ncbi:MAG: aspartyl protease family protein [Burkholderiales bacterium]|nr:aspartyl protease family protein [Burkholderiales bacterium]